jgi:hypothetical protein
MDGVKGRAAVASVALPYMAVQSPAPNAATTERGPPDQPRQNVALVCFRYCDRQRPQPNGGTRFVASVSTCARGHDGEWPSKITPRARPRRSVALQNHTPCSATTERGPPDHPKTCAQNAHKLRRKELTDTVRTVVRWQPTASPADAAIERQARNPYPPRHT